MVVFEAKRKVFNTGHLISFLLQTWWILSCNMFGPVRAKNISEDYEWLENNTYVDYTVPSNLTQDSSSSELSYSADFISCIKWPLVLDEDFFFHSNNSIQLLCSNYSFCYKYEYSQGYHKISADGSVAYVCIPDELNAYLYPVDYAYVAFWAASLIFLILSLVLHLWVVRGIRTAGVRPMFCHQLSLTFFYFFLVLRNTNSLGDKGWLWDWANIGAYYSLRSAFTWLNVISFDMWRTLHPKRILLHSQSVTNSNSSLRFFYQSLYSWGVPTLMLLLSYCLLYVPSTDVKIVASAGILYVNLAQLVCMRSGVTIIVCINAVFCTLVVFNLRRIRKDTAHSKLVTAAVQESYSICLKIVVLSGFIWLVETAQWVIIRYQQFFVYWLLPDLLSCGGQGLWLFLIYCCNKSVFKATVKNIKDLWHNQ